MTEDIQIADPKAFGLSAFRELLAPDDRHIIGEEPGSYDAVREGLILSLAPLTPYECVLAENLVAIEWELIQRRSLRTNELRNSARGKLHSALSTALDSKFSSQLDEAWEAHVANGGGEDEWEEPIELNYSTRQEMASDLCDRAMSLTLIDQQTAYKEICNLGINPIDAMGQAYTDWESDAGNHQTAIETLEKRRREVMRDFASLQATRPIEGEVITA